ncbi:uncharacterized protein BDR25DRAFT_282499 [Lindgomyces ingoldianus]|uniref:Uncharacterized protein n=1 Tax=Lindgomyces ingoldianus TaxID=673940 RepID=A0ACB6R1Q4_9PLEO|nr:uncharacterized protein BDR25DRAFT_282499 [Lindgomyces ingoldianus]KAF2473188.1 hypothetical protein BDR25DRAFT_282499 [Lindgomyces ingoldianus]
MAAPTLPPRPARSTQNVPSSSSSMDVPKIPPRPKRSADRSISPNRDTFARSPLNDPAFLTNGGKFQHKDTHLSAELPPRPPSVTLPSIGQEGSEYASLEELHKTDSDQEPSPQQTKNIAGDLPLYAPTASVPSATAKSRIATVTRTDSSQAAAAGIGKSLFPDEKSAHGPESGCSESSNGGRSRPTSIYKETEEQGIPEIGLQVPMYPNAGDVQAPTPSPYEQGAGATGVGFSNKGGQPSGRHHSRTKSGREIFHGPPGSYGMHGHGVIPNNEFEQKWYERHPEDLKREKQGEYGPHIQENRKDYHWVGDDLVKLVRSSANMGIGMGTSREVIGTPDEQVGYMASEEFASRITGPRPTSGRPPSIHKTEKVESPLKQMSFPANTLEKKGDDEADDEVIHIDPPSHRSSKIGGGGYDPPKEDLGPEGGNTAEEGGWVSERGYGVPILASDEIDKHPDAEFRQPAVSPELERRGSGEYTINEVDGVPSYITGRQSVSRGSSRNNSIHSGTPGLQRFTSPGERDRSGTPLDHVREYEPLFPDDEEHEKKPKTSTEKLKRPDLARHHFPSQDVWEDTPSSLLITTTVDTPQAPEEPSTPGEVDSSKGFEKPATEKARKEDTPEEDQKSFLPEKTKRFAKSNLNKDVLGDMPTRPGMQPRFPSHDIWEDAPDHGQLVTTVSAPQIEDTNEYAEDSPAVEKPTVPARPFITARPQKVKELSPIDKKAPVIPDKPKPQVPVRPSKPITKKSEDSVPQVEARDEAPPPKAKPPVPVRPGGSKIAALQAGFLKDLNSKLGLGPQAPKVKEPEPEKEEEAPKPLQDARKGRAKGPQRRKPTSSPSPAAAATAVAEVAVPAPKLEFATVSTLWSIADDGAVDVPAAKVAKEIAKALKVPERKDTAGKLSVPEETMEKGEDVEPEEAELVKTATKETALENRVQPTLEPEPEPEPEPELELESDGGVKLDKKDSIEVPELVATTTTTVEDPEEKMGRKGSVA